MVWSRSSGGNRAGLVSGRGGATSTWACGVLAAGGKSSSPKKKGFFRKWCSRSVVAKGVKQQLKTDIQRSGLCIINTRGDLQCEQDQ